MRTDYFQYLLTIDKHHSISAAAQELYLGQTTLSSIVKDIEEEIGFQIFSRTYNGVKTTIEGESALALMREITLKVETMQSLNNVLFTTQPVQIALSPSISYALSLPLNSLFLKSNPLGNIFYQEVAGHKVGSHLIKNAVNIGLTFFDDNQLCEYVTTANKYQLQVDILMRDSLYVLLRKDHLLASYPSIPINEVCNYTIAIPAHFDTYENSFAYTESLSPTNHYIIFPHITSVKKSVLQGNAIAILSGYTCQHCCDNDPSQSLTYIKLHHIDRENIMNLCLIRRHDTNLRYFEKLAISCIQTHFQSLSLSNPKGQYEENELF